MTAGVEDARQARALTLAWVSVIAAATLGWLPLVQWVGQWFQTPPAQVISFGSDALSEIGGYTCVGGWACAWVAALAGVALLLLRRRAIWLALVLVAVGAAGAFVGQVVQIAAWFFPGDDATQMGVMFDWTWVVGWLEWTVPTLLLAVLAGFAAAGRRPLAEWAAARHASASEA